MDEADPAVRIAALLEALHVERARAADQRDSLLTPAPSRSGKGKLSPVDIARLVLDDSADPAEVDEMEEQIAALDHRIERIENDLLQTRARTLAGVSAVLDLALGRLMEQTVEDPQDVFFDYGSTRVVALLQRAAADLRAQLDPATLSNDVLEDESVATLPLARRGTR